MNDNMKSYIGYDLPTESQNKQNFQTHWFTKQKKTKQKKIGRIISKNLKNATNFKQKKIIVKT